MSVELEDALFALGQADEHVEDTMMPSAPAEQIAFDTLTEEDKQNVVERMSIEDKFVLLRTLSKHDFTDAVVSETGLADAILETIPPDEQLTLLEDIPNEERVVLLKAVSSPSHRTKLLERLPVKQKIELIRIHSSLDGLNETFGGQAFGDYILDAMSEEDKLNLLEYLPTDEKLAIVEAMPLEDKLILLRTLSNIDKPLDAVESLPDIGNMILESMDGDEKIKMIEVLTDAERSQMLNSATESDRAIILGGGSVESRVKLLRKLSKVSGVPWSFGQQLMCTMRYR